MTLIFHVGLLNLVCLLSHTALHALVAGKDKNPVSGAAAAAGGQDEGRSGFARRALDRGLRASNQFLYRSIFNLLPAFIETICVVLMMIQRAGTVVGLTAAAVAYSFVGLTMLVMRKRIPILRRQLRDEGEAHTLHNTHLHTHTVHAHYDVQR